MRDVTKDHCLGSALISFSVQPPCFSVSLGGANAAEPAPQRHRETQEVAQSFILGHYHCSSVMKLDDKLKHVEHCFELAIRLIFSLKVHPEICR